MTKIYINPKQRLALWIKNMSYDFNPYNVVCCNPVYCEKVTVGILLGWDSNP